jgi:hypothetical protein
MDFNAFNEITRMIVPFAPLLASFGEAASTGAAKKIGEDVWSELKSVWKGITSRAKNMQAIQSAADAVARDTSDPASIERLAQEIKAALNDDEAFINDVTARLKHATMRINMATKGGSQIAVTDNASFTARDIDMSTRIGPSREDVEMREQRSALQGILAQFDRRAVRDQMEEEDVYFMIRSLHELRTSVQRMGITRVSDQVVQVLLRQMIEEIRDIEAIAEILMAQAPQKDWADSILDLRMFGSRVGRDEAIEARRSVLERRFQEVQQFCADRTRHHFQRAMDVDHLALEEVEGPIRPENLEVATPLNTSRLASDVFCLYLFGVIDGLKHRILAKLELLENLCVDTTSSHRKINGLRVRSTCRAEPALSHVTTVSS